MKKNMKENFPLYTILNNINYISYSPGDQLEDAYHGDYLSLEGREKGEEKKREVQLKSNFRFVLNNFVYHVSHV